jgi:methylmalonyl-CoA/ethylmalonyl-CoA epimerase
MINHTDKIHHIGRVVSNIGEELKHYKTLGFRCDKSVKIDRYQKVKVGLVYLDDGIFLELLEPHGKESPIKNFLAKGGGLHHICYSVENLKNKMQSLKERGIVLSNPTPSVFNGRKVFFFYSRRGEIIEFIEESNT